MKNRKLLFFGLSFLLLLCAGGIFFWEKKQRAAITTQHKPYNLLVISACSLNPQYMNLYGEKMSNTPNLNKLAEQSIIFRNAVTSMAWSNVSGHFVSLTRKELSDVGYEAIGRPFSAQEAARHYLETHEELAPYYFRLPEKHGKLGGRGNIRSEMLELRRRILSQRDKPFFLETHIKLTHAPYAFDEAVFSGDLFADAPPWFKEYRETLYSHPEKLPVIMLTTSRGRREELGLTRMLHANKHLRGSRALKSALKKEAATLMGLINNPKILADWKAGKGYERDLEYIKYMYKKRIEHFDTRIAQILNLYGNEELRNNTIVIFTGDHGESFMKHGYLTHGETVYDEALRYPMLIHIPGMKKRIDFEPQFYQASILKLVRALMRQEINAANIEEYLHKRAPEDEIIFGRNCNLTLRSVRQRNKWKFIQNIADDSRQLFDLANDPGETKNVIHAHPQIAADLEAKLFDYNGGGNRLMHNCVPGEEN